MGIREKLSEILSILPEGDIIWLYHYLCEYYGIVDGS
jgi:hypothetical protein